MSPSSEKRKSSSAHLVTNSEQNFSRGCGGRKVCHYFLLESQNPSSTPPKAVARGGTRIPCEIPITLTSLDPRDPFSEPCKIILANLGGCAARSPRPVQTGMIVHLNGLPTKTEVAARVVHCISLGEYEKLWILGLALNESGNVWGIEPVPEDWEQQG